MTAQMNEATNTNQQGIVEDSAFSPERATERAEVSDKAQRAKAVAEELSRLTSARKNELLLAAAGALVASTEEILVANAKDIEAGRARGFSDSLLDYLRLDAACVEGIAGGLRQVAALPDPIGEVPRGSTLPNGIKFSQVNVPLGVMGMIYETRPNVTVDTFGLALKSDNVTLLRGSEPAVYSNTQLVMVLREVLANRNVPENLVQLLPCETHGSVQDLTTARGLVDVMIPHDDAGLIEAVVTKATVPTIETGTGNCHIYIDASADIDEAIALMINDKTRRPSICNAAETVLIDSTLSAQDQARILDVLADVGVAIHGDVDNLVASGWTGEVIPTMTGDWSDEYLSLGIAACIVNGVVAATDHITEYSSGHTEAISVRDWGVCQKFVDQVDITAVSVNASTAFTDGEQYGFGVEIGTSTQKLHARGPMGLSELTSSKWVLAGRGQTRPWCPGRVPYMIKHKRSVRSRVYAALTSKLAETPRQRIGVMGGTFDPTHNGHLVATNEVADRFDPDFVLFVPTDEPWQKRGRKVSHSENRYLMAATTTASNPQFSVSRVDIDRPGAIYTVDMLWDLKAIYPDAGLFFITGAGALQKTMTWRDWEEMFNTATSVGVTRPGVHLRAEDLEGIDAPRLHLIETPAMAISSTDCRKHAEAGRPVWYLVSNGVVQYIARRGLYQSSGGTVGPVGPASVNLTSEDAALVDAAPVDAKSDIAD